MQTAARQVLMFAFAALAAFHGAATTEAADEIFDARGFVAGRDHFSQLPYEHVDPLTGNLLLTHEDLRLPGNAGFDLVVQRTYNSKIYSNYHSSADSGISEDSWAGVGWSVHQGRILNSLAIVPGPVEMPDGSRHELFQQLAGCNSCFVTKELWIFDKDTHTLKLPNGRVYVFGHAASVGGSTARFATSVSDQFGNSIGIAYNTTYAGAISSITQDLGGGSTRQIMFTTETSTGSLSQMNFDGRAWTYTQQRPATNLDAGMSQLTKVAPPAGAPWRYEYYTTSPARHAIKKVTTPFDGTIEYTHTAVNFNIGSSVQVASPAVTSRSVSGHAVAQGTWTYAYAQGTGKNQTRITPPCGGETVFTFAGVGNYSSGVPVWTVGLTTKRDTLEDSTTLESRTFTWIPSVQLSSSTKTVGMNTDYGIYAPLLKEARTTRGTKVWTTTHSYHSVHFNDYGRPYHTLETADDDTTRTRTLTFKHDSTPYVRALVLDDTMAAAGVSAVSSAEYDGLGFKTSSTVRGVTTSFGKDGRGNVRSIRDGLLNETIYAYKNGVVSSITTPGHITTREINEDSTIAWERRRGFTSSFDYDDLGRLVSVTPPAGNQTTTDYDGGASTYARTVTVTRGSSRREQTLDGFGREIAASNSVGIRTEQEFDACGRLSRRSLPFYAGSYAPF